MKYLICLFILFLMHSCIVEENLLIPHCGDVHIVRVEEKYYWISGPCFQTPVKVRNRDGLTSEDVGRGLILKDEFRAQEY